MAKNIVVCMDGTWNTPNIDEDGDDDQTNVVKLFDQVQEKSSDGRNQVKYYIKGVGTDWCDRLMGGAFGVGLSAKIKEAYKYVALNYEEGDSLYFFGFSRGAYSVRSLVGLIRKSGLLSVKKVGLDALDNYIDYAYSLYRIRNDGVDSSAATSFRKTYCDTPKIKMVGVWDTVGALGIPVKSFNFFIKEFYEFHDTELSAIVENAFHAVAVDEWREDYAATLWSPKEKPNQYVEQVWFPGAHANVGGGYRSSNLSLVPLVWMIANAKKCGLGIKDLRISAALKKITPEAIVNSYENFLSGAYSQMKSPYFRPIGVTAYGNEAIHELVIEFLKGDSYRPKNPVKEYLCGDFRPVGKLRI